MDSTATDRDKAQSTVWQRKRANRIGLRHFRETAILQSSREGDGNDAKFSRYKAGA